MKRLLAAGLLLALVVCAATVGAQNQSPPAHMLKGLTSTDVLVALGEEDLTLKRQLQTDVELRLRQSGITVSKGEADLFVVVNALGRDEIGYAYSVRVELKQPVMVLANRVGAIATTWSVGGISTTPTSRFAASVRNDVRDMVDEFINAVLSMNPKK
jgi:hypothetical protein